MTDWGALRRMMPVPAATGAAVDWTRLSESWGREFPFDYRRFMELYGFGTIQNLPGLAVRSYDLRDRSVSGPA